MEENKTLAEMNEMFNSKTLTYRINGFAEACQLIDLYQTPRIDSRILVSKKEENSGVKGKKDIAKEALVYYIVANKCKNYLNDKYGICNEVSIRGNYRNIVFNFHNYYNDDDKIDEKILDIPFTLEVFNTVSKNTYHLEITSLDGNDPQITIAKIREYKSDRIYDKYTFTTKVDGFNTILKLLKCFINYPELFCKNCTEVVNSRKIEFTRDELDNILLDDDRIDEPINKEKQELNETGVFMSDYNFVEEIKNRYKVDELNSNTLTYRINSFISACNMNLENSVLSKDISATNLEYANLTSEDGKAFDLKFFRNYKEKEGRYFTLMGNYGDLDVLFTNYYDKDKNYSKINELPFKISLKKKYNNFDYSMDIVMESKPRVKFAIRKNSDKMMLPYVISFPANVLDFGLILKMVKSFVNDPESLLSTYDKCLKQKGTSLTNGDLIKGITNDESLDEPVKGFKKVIRSLFK